MKERKPGESWTCIVMSIPPLWRWGLSSESKLTVQAGASHSLCAVAVKWGECIRRVHGVFISSAVTLHDWMLYVTKCKPSAFLLYVIMSLYSASVWRTIRCVVHTLHIELISKAYGSLQFVMLIILIFSRGFRWRRKPEFPEKTPLSSRDH